MPRNDRKLSKDEWKLIKALRRAEKLVQHGTPDAFQDEVRCAEELLHSLLYPSKPVRLNDEDEETLDRVSSTARNIVGNAKSRCKEGTGISLHYVVYKKSGRVTWSSLGLIQEALVGGVCCKGVGGEPCARNLVFDRLRTTNLSLLEFDHVYEMKDTIKSLRLAVEFAATKPEVQKLTKRKFGTLTAEGAIKASINKCEGSKWSLKKAPKHYRQMYDLVQKFVDLEGARRDLFSVWNPESPTRGGTFRCHDCHVRACSHHERFDDRRYIK